MSRVTKNFIKFGTGTNDVNSRVLPANFTPTYYTPAQVASEGTDKVSAHLKGIDNFLATTGSTSGDIGLTSFSAADNQSSPADVTAFAFANASIRSFEAQVSVTRGSTYQAMKFLGIQKGSSWELSQDFVGDDCGLVFTISTSGQVKYTSTNTGSTATVKFRASVTST